MSPQQQAETSPQRTTVGQQQQQRQRRRHVPIVVTLIIVIAVASMNTRSTSTSISEYESDYLASFAASSPTATEEESGCAVLLFGLPRHFRSIVLPSLQIHVLTPNPACDLFVHSYNVTSVTNIRNGEVSAVARPEELFSLLDSDDEANDRHVEVVLENMDSFYKLRNETMSHYRDEHWSYKKWAGKLMYPSAMENMIKQWHSINSVWDIMARQEMVTNRRYDRVGLLRNDVYYGTDILVQQNDDDEGWGEAVVPAFAPFPVNDRMFVGKRHLAQIWATSRFPGAHSYLETPRGKSKKKPDGLHSETFMQEFVFESFPNGTTLDTRNDICFFRVRGTGVVLTDDCWCADKNANKGPCPPSVHKDWPTTVQNETGLTCVPYGENGVSQTICLVA